MQPYVAIDPDAVAALVEEHLPPVVRTIVAAYWAGPTLLSNVADKELGSFQITIDWHPNDDGRMMSNVEYELLQILRVNAAYESESDSHAVMGVSRLVMFRPPARSVIPPTYNTGRYDPLTLPSVTPNVRTILSHCYTMLAFSACQIKLYELYQPHAAAQLVGIRTGHKYGEQQQANTDLEIAEYIKLREQVGCMMDESCECYSCRNELHHICRSEKSDTCACMNQCLCTCEYCTDGIKCADTQGLCANQNLLCFSKWRPPKGPL